MKLPLSAFTEVIEALLRSGGEFKSATKYLSTDTAVRATHQGRPKSRHRSETLLVTYGAPNYEERKFIKLCQKAGVPFPVQEIQFKRWPVPRNYTKSPKV